tara:strand:- start:984 stop:1190 length:207 start_codon:yes stop_codon:yes gene_type:complete
LSISDGNIVDLSTLQDITKGEDLPTQETVDKGSVYLDIDSSIFLTDLSKNESIKIKGNTIGIAVQYKF